MRIAILSSLLGVEATGQSAVPAAIAARLAAAGQDVSIIATDCAVGGGPVTSYVAVPDTVRVHIFPSTGKINRRLFRSTALTDWLRKHIDEFDVLDVQGVWSVVGKDAAQIFADAGKPYVLTPHGMMTSYDWKKSMLRRKLFFRFGFGKIWRNADAVRFLSLGEQENSFYPAAGRTAIVPNFIDLPPASTPESRRNARERLGIAPETRMLIFLGRIVHQKGVKEIISAFEVASSQHPNLKLYLVGPYENEYGEEVRSLVKRSAFSDRIVLTGPVFGAEKYDYLRASDAFITLSHNEGQSVAHLEAMGEGLPMILTSSSNMDGLTEYGAGVLTTHNPTDAAQAILRVISDENMQTNMSRNARRLIEERYTPEVVIPQLTGLYQELIERTGRYR